MPPQERLMKVSQARYRRALAIIAVAAALSAVTGCHKKDKAVKPSSLGPMPAAAAAAPTATLTADPVTVDLGQSVVLNWRTQNANVVTIDGVGEVPANGTQTVSPSSS